MRALLVFILLFTQLIAARTAVIVTKSGKKLKGRVTSERNTLEWRKDIYSYVNASGQVERFFLKPEKKGKTALSYIKEITRIEPSEAPVKFAEVEIEGEGLKKARLLCYYRIKLGNNRNLYISDFITLDSFYIDAQDGGGKTRIYLSHIKSLKFTSAQTAEKTVKPAVKKPPKKKPEAKAPEKKPVEAETPAEIKEEKKPEDDGYSSLSDYPGLRRNTNKVIIAGEEGEIAGEFNIVLLLMSVLLLSASLVMIYLLVKGRRPAGARGRSRAKRN